MEDLYKAGMAGIGNKVAMQVIRRIVRDRTLNDTEKLEAIVTVIHSFENEGRVTPWQNCTTPMKSRGSLTRN